MKIEIPPFEKARVTVVGDVMLDRYWHGDTTRISPEAPVPVVHIGRSEDRAGGAGNVALNIASLGAQVNLCAILGDDSEGLTLEKIISEHQVACHLLKLPGIQTITKLRVIGRSQQLIRLDLEQHLGKLNLETLFATFAAKLADSDLVILSDYGKGTLRFANQYIKLAREANVPVLVDPKSKDFKIYHGATIITPNLSEFEAVVGHCANEADIEQKGAHLAEQYDFAAVLVTRGAHGMSLITRDKKAVHLPTRSREVYDVTGAGDTVIATLGAALAAGENLHDAIVLANAAAGITVKKLGAAAVSVAELRRAMQRQQDPWAAILNEENIMQEITDARAHGEKIVMTNGCFDILHAGHITYLEKAKALGHRLIIAVNDDASVKRLKGKERPINSLEQRLLILAALRAVDWVVPFSDDTPEKLIRKISPDILVKGGDYEVQQIAGSSYVQSYGGEVVIVPFVEGFSTSGTIKKMKSEK